VLYSYLIHWPWFVAISVVALLGAYIYTHITKPVYQATASIAIFDMEDDNRYSNDFFSGSLNTLSMTGNRLEDEKVVLTSRNIMQRVVEDTGLHEYFAGDTAAATAFCRGGLTIANSSKNGSVLNLTFRDTDRERGRRILASLIKEYNREALSHKNRMALSMIAFLDDRLAQLSRNLGFTESTMQSYKTREQLIDLRSNISMDLSAQHEYENKLLDVDIQLHMSTYIHDFLNDPSTAYQLLPVNNSVLRTDLSNLINEYNREVLERESMLKTMEARNPVVVKQTEAVDAIRRNVLSSIAGIKHGLEIQRNEILQKNEYFNQRITSMPKHEQEMNSMDREQQLEASVYLMLKEQRERAGIELAISTDRVRIIEQPAAGLAPIAPRTTVIYGGSMLAGWVMVGSLIFLRGMFRKRIVSLSEVEETGLTMVGKLPYVRMGGRAEEHHRQLLDESFRRLRSNIRSHMPEGSKSILVTSASMGEGKTFCSVRLARALSLLDSRVLLVGLDLRNPQIGKFFGFHHLAGVADYLSGDETDIETLIRPVEDNDNLFVITAGKECKNSAELLERGSLDTLFEYFRNHFDYIVIDTAPVALVVDTFTLRRVSDYTLFVTRIGHSNRQINEVLAEMQVNGWIRDRIGMIANCANRTEGYDYRHYRYYYRYRKYSYYYNKS
jgi:capsular exopolysaccharide synthesis family protein